MKQLSSHDGGWRRAGKLYRLRDYVASSLDPVVDAR
jgi:hypothetical protein